SPERELRGQKAILCQQRSQARKAGVTGLGGERQNAQDRELEDGEEKAERPIKYLVSQLSNHRGVAGRTGLDAIGERKEGDAQEERTQNARHPGQRDSRVA